MSKSLKLFGFRNNAMAGVADSVDRAVLTVRPLQPILAESLLGRSAPLGSFRVSSDVSVCTAASGEMALDDARSTLCGTHRTRGVCPIPMDRPKCGDRFVSRFFGGWGIGDRSGSLTGQGAVRGHDPWRKDRGRGCWDSSVSSLNRQTVAIVLEAHPPAAAAHPWESPFLSHDDDASPHLSDAAAGGDG